MSEAADNSAKRTRLVVAGTVPADRGVPVPRELRSYGPGGPVQQGELPSTLRELIAMIAKRKWIILSVLAACLAIGTVRTLMLVPLYTSSVRLQIDRNVTRVYEGGNVTPLEGSDSEFLRTQYELLQSRAIAERVVGQLRLGADADFFRPRQMSVLGLLSALAGPSSPPGHTAGAASARDAAAAGIVQGARTVRPVSGSRLVDISYTDPEPERAQRIVTAFAQAFIASNLDKRFEANAYAKQFLDDQIRQLKIRLEDSDTKLLAFAAKEQIVTVSEKSSIAESNLASASATVGILASERIRHEQQWRQVDATDAINLPQFLANAVIAELRAKRKLLELDYQEKLQTFKPGYPAMIEITRKIAEIDRQTAAEVLSIKASLKGAYENAASQEAEMRKRVDALKGDALELQKQMLQYSLLKREVDTNRALYDGLLQRFKEVDVASGVGANTVFIVDRAQLPGAPSSPNLPNAILLSLALGLGAGLLAGWITERLDDRVASLEDMERVSGLATLGVIPKVGSGKDVPGELGDPRSALSEAYRSLCTALQFATEGGLPKSLLITSANPAEGKSITALAIASHFARLGLKVLVVDADLRKPSLHAKLGLDNAVGLSTYLSGSCTPPDAIQKTGMANLMFMASGPVPGNAADLLGSARLASLVTVGFQVFDLIVFDGPPIMGLADGPLLSNATAATVYVAAAGHSRAGAIRGALRRLQHARAPVLGTVLTRYDARRAGYGYGYGDGVYGYDTGYTGYPAEPAAPVALPVVVSEPPARTRDG